MHIYIYMAVCQNLVPLVNIKIAGKWMFIPLKMVLIGIDPYPYNQYNLMLEMILVTWWPEGDLSFKRLRGPSTRPDWKRFAPRWLSRPSWNGEKWDIDGGYIDIYIYIYIRLESLSHNIWGYRTGKFISWDIIIYIYIWDKLSSFPRNGI